MNDKMKHYKTKINEILVYVVLTEFLLFGSVWTMFGVSGKLYLFLYWGAVLLGMFKICLQHNSLKEWLLIIGLGILAIFSWRGSWDKTPLLLFLGIAISKDIDLEKVIKVDFIARILIAVVMIVCPLIGVTACSFVDNGVRTRLFFGWSHAGGMGLAFLVILMEWMYLRHLKFRWFDYLGICAVWMFEHFTGNARTTDVIMVVLLVSEIVATILSRKKPYFEQYRLWALGCAIACLSAVILPFIGVQMYLNHPVDMSTVTNNFLSRFLQPGWFYMTHGLTLFGTPYDPYVYDYLDMCFGYVTLHLGVVMAVIVLILMIRAILWAYKRKDEKFLLLFMLVLLRSTIESEHFTLVYAFFPMLLGMSLWEQKNE